MHFSEEGSGAFVGCSHQLSGPQSAIVWAEACHVEVQGKEGRKICREVSVMWAGTGLLGVFSNKPRLDLIRLQLTAVS